MVAALQAANAPTVFMVRGVSDFADEEKGSVGVAQWHSYVCNIAAAYTIALLQSRPVPLQTDAKSPRISVKETMSSARLGISFHAS